MKKYLLLFILPLLLTGCGQNTKTKLTLQPNSLFYLKSSNNVQKSKVQNKIVMKANAADEVDYTFSIPKTQEQSLNLKNANDLIIGRERILLEPVAINYAVQDNVVTTNEVSRMTTEETETNFSPIVEMSGSGYGNDDIDLSLYDTPQLRTCYAISNSEGVLQSEYYDVAITITDDIAPTTTVSQNDTLKLENLGISYKNSNEEDEEKIITKILSNYEDNDLNTTMSVVFYNADYSVEESLTNVLSDIRQSDTLIANNELQYQTLYFKVLDDNGNVSDPATAYLLLEDDVDPYLVNKDGEIVETANFGFNEDRFYYPDLETDLYEQFVEKGYKVFDEVDGEISIENIDLTFSSDGTHLFALDKSGNYLVLADNTSKLIDTNQIIHVWYPEGSSETLNPERGLQWIFIEGKKEIEIIGPNLQENQFKIDWLGTDGNGHVQIPKTINVYGIEYPVTTLGFRAFYSTSVTSLNGSNKYCGYIDFTDTNISEIESEAIGFAGSDLSFILDTSSEKGLSVYSRNIMGYKNAYISNNVIFLDYASCSSINTYFEFSKERRNELEANGQFKVLYNDQKEVHNAWYNYNDNKATFTYNVTLDEYKELTK